MDPTTQRLMVAQEFCQTLLALLDLPTKPQRAQVQAAIDATNAKLTSIVAQETQTQPPLVAPQLVPPNTK